MRAINIIFDGPPSHESGRFVEVEDDRGRGIAIGNWIERADGLWALRIEMENAKPSCPECNSPNTDVGRRPQVWWCTDCIRLFEETPIRK